MHIRACVAREAREDVSKRSQLTAQVIGAKNNRKCYLCSVGQAVCIGEAGVLGPDVSEGRCNCIPPIYHALKGGPWIDASRRTGRVITVIGKGSPREKVKKGEGDVQKFSMAMKVVLARAHSGEEELI